MKAAFRVGHAHFYEGDCFEWLARRRANSVHGVVCDPPFGREYTAREIEMQRNGNKGGIWRLPPSFDGWKRTPLPRFTVLSNREVAEILEYFAEWATLLRRVVVPGAHILVASSALLSHVIGTAVETAGFERRGYVIRLVRTMRGGDRPKGAHEEYPDVSVIPRAMFEPWVLFRRPIEGRVRDNLATWGTGGLRRPVSGQPFGDVIKSGRASARERTIAPHPSLKPQQFLRQAVWSILPLGRGVVLDCFAGAGSTLAAAEAVGYRSAGVEIDPQYTAMARTAIRQLREMEVAAVAAPDQRARSSRRRKSAATTLRDAGLSLIEGGPQTGPTASDAEAAMSRAVIRSDGVPASVVVSADSADGAHQRGDRRSRNGAGELVLSATNAHEISRRH